MERLLAESRVTTKDGIIVVDKAHHVDAVRRIA